MWQLEEKNLQASPNDVNDPIISPFAHFKSEKINFA